MNDIEKRAREIADVLPAQLDASAWPNGYGDGWNDCARIAHEEILPAIIAALSATPQVPEITDQDVYTLIGQSRICAMKGETDMPSYFMELAAKLARLVGDQGLAHRAAEMLADMPEPQA